MGRAFLGGWMLLLLWLQAACVAGPPMTRGGGEGETRHAVSLSTRFDAVRVSERELDEAIKSPAGSG